MAAERADDCDERHPDVRLVDCCPVRGAAADNRAPRRDRRSRFQSRGSKPVSCCRQHPTNAAKRQKVLARAPSTRDPEPTSTWPRPGAAKLYAAWIGLRVVVLGA